VIVSSSRHALHVLVLAGLAALPIGWHALASPTADGCRDAESLLASERIGEGSVTERWPPPPGPPDVRRIGGAIAPPTPDVFSMRFRVSRGFMPSLYYGSLEVHAIDPTFGHDNAGELIRIEADGVDLPVHWLEDSFSSNFRVRAHFYVFDGRPVAYVFPAGMAVAARQLFYGTLPVTLFAFRAEGGVLAIDAMRSAARDWLRAAWLRHQEVCGR
jgi:hypothetical protein